jgi:hypothetical protein
VVAVSFVMWSISSLIKAIEEQKLAT